RDGARLPAATARAALPLRAARPRTLAGRDGGPRRRRAHGRAPPPARALVLHAPPRASRSVTARLRARDRHEARAREPAGDTVAGQPVALGRRVVEVDEKTARRETGVAEGRVEIERRPAREPPELRDATSHAVAHRALELRFEREHDDGDARTAGRRG